MRPIPSSIAPERYENSERKALQNTCDKDSQVAQAVRRIWAVRNKRFFFEEKDIHTIISV